MITRAAGVTLCLLLNVSASGEDLFRSRIAPILETHCLACHNDIDRQAEFSLQTKAAMLDSGYVVPGVPADSHLLSVVTGTDDEPAAMPKDSDPLTAEDVQALRQWIAAGADWPDQLQLSPPVVDDFNWWSFQPLTRPPVPQFAAGSPAAQWVRNPIDAFIMQRLQQQGLQPSPAATQQTLRRRLSYDLIGLPTLPEIAADRSQPDLPDLIEQLLQSPHYGERWARHWLDIVKYADTCGYDKDKLRPHAWPYRDYVIRSLNEDKPYTRFVQEQIAGDVLFPGDPDGILGLGFIAAGPWDFIGHVEVPEAKIDGQVARNLDRDDMVSNTLNTFCSVTIQCARCHNHKFDPFTQEHYYRLQAVFAAVDRADRTYHSDPAIQRQRTELTTKLAAVTAELDALNQQVQDKAGPELQQLAEQVAELRQALKPVQPRPEFGYHSQIAAAAETTKWVEVDLGREIAVAAVVLHPCYDEFNQIGAGFGFPRRFRVEARDQAGRVVLLTDDSEADFGNPGLQPVEIPSAGQAVRFIRVTATTLAPRQNDFIFALAELRVLDAAGTNHAAGASVTAQDSIEAPVRWSTENLTDGYWPAAANSTAAAALAAAESRRLQLLNSALNSQQLSRRQQLQQLQQDVQQQLQDLPEGHQVYAAATDFPAQGNFQPTQGIPREIRLLHRGNVTQPQHLVQPGTIPLTAGDDGLLPLPEQADEADRRAALAKWMTSPDNPLTWRSIANRVWQYHFGEGLVDSPNDFGRMGRQPTHPELLDWLAAEFRETESLKHLHRLIVSSATWQQTSQLTPAAQQAVEVDGENRLLWRMQRRRLSAEEIRDSMLLVSGQLDTTMGGPGFYLFELEKTEHSPHFEYHKFDPADPATHRRSVYRFVVRSQPDPLMTTLDCADSSQSTPKRTETLTSLQALSLLNNRFVLTMAPAFAARLQAEADTDAERVELAFRLTTGREATAAEAESLLQYSRQFGLANLCRVLFNLSEFVFVD